MFKKVFSLVLITSIISIPYFTGLVNPIKNMGVETTYEYQINPPEHDMDHWNSTEMPWDLFGDWSIPERAVYPWQWTLWAKSEKYYNPTDVINDHTSYLDKSKINNISSFDYKRENFHKTFKNHKQINGFEGAENHEHSTSIDGNGNVIDEGWIWTDDIDSFKDDDFTLLAKTPMRGIIPFWEYTNAFNTYILSETSNGKSDSSNLYYNKYYNYSKAINNYVNTSKARYPLLYPYIKDPSLLKQSFNLDSDEYILPNDYELVRSEYLTDGTLKNAIIGDIYDNNWTVGGFMSYIGDFLVWFWNNHGITQADRDAGLTELKPGQINIEARFEDPDGKMYELDNGSFLSSDKNNDSNIKLGNEAGKASIFDLAFDYIEIPYVLNWDKDPNTFYKEDWDQTSGFYFAGVDKLNSSAKNKLYNDNPTYKWYRPEDVINSENFFGYDENKSDVYQMFSPFVEQMNQADITKTKIGNNVLTKNDSNKISDKLNVELYKESTFKEFKNDFENLLITDENGINSQFIKFFSSDDAVVSNYYGNLSKDGKEFLGRNRFQTGYYPIEDLSLSDLNIVYADVNGSPIDDNTQLKDINMNKINVNISPKNTANASLFFDFSKDKSFEFETNKLVSNITPDKKDKSSNVTNIIIGSIIGFTFIILTIIGGGIFAMSKKRSKIDNNKK